VIDFDAWTVDLHTLSATHDSGFKLHIEGSPKDPSSVSPGRFPPELNGIEKVRLLRTGVEAIAKAAKKKTVHKPTSSYVPPANKPKRPTLSLKKKTLDNQS